MDTRRPLAKILLVQHDDLWREALARMLRRRGYEAETAACGAEALQRLERMRLPPRLILVDLPDSCGGKDLLAILMESPVSARSRVLPIDCRELAVPERRAITRFFSRIENALERGVLPARVTSAPTGSRLEPRSARRGPRRASATA